VNSEDAMGNLRSCKRLALALGLFMWAYSGCEGGSGAILSGAGESCTKTADCEWGLKCVAMMCVVDDTAEKDTFGEADAADPDCYPNCESQQAPKWIAIPRGTFQMGCSPGDDDCENNEKPGHPVTVASFEMLETEVTTGQYLAVIGSDHSIGAGGPDYPVEYVSRDEAKYFCERIGARLPTEAEWEYAARGGTTTIYSCGDDFVCVDWIAWHDSNSNGMKHAVKGKNPNGYGLYDMTGNVWEWVEDWYHETYDGAPAQGYPAWTEPDSFYRVVRGGSFEGLDVYGYSRVSFRSAYLNPKYKSPYLGFRCARSE
jgi:formylglycine-generating enzyme required for sulfatase activity